MAANRNPTFSERQPAFNPKGPSTLSNGAFVTCAVTGSRGTWLGVTGSDAVARSFGALIETTSESSLFVSLTFSRCPLALRSLLSLLLIFLVSAATADPSTGRSLGVLNQSESTLLDGISGFATEVLSEYAKTK